jgi:3-isopropylmalate/(R)-2-methylmalate dehydratase large subunit
MTPIGRGDVKRGGFVKGCSKLKRRGKGSSREQSPYAEMCAGIRLVIAENIERIYKQNCQTWACCINRFSLTTKSALEKKFR